MTRYPEVEPIREQREIQDEELSVTLMEKLWFWMQQTEPQNLTLSAYIEKAFLMVLVS